MLRYYYYFRHCTRHRLCGRGALSNRTKIAPAIFSRSSSAMHRSDSRIAISARRRVSLFFARRSPGDRGTVTRGRFPAGIGIAREIVSSAPPRRTTRTTMMRPIDKVHRNKGALSGAIASLSGPVSARRCNLQLHLAVIRHYGRDCSVMGEPRERG